MLDLQHLSIVREVDRCGSLTAAAEKLSLSQSAVSHAIRGRLWFNYCQREHGSTATDTDTTHLSRAVRCPAAKPFEEELIWGVELSHPKRWI